MKYNHKKTVIPFETVRLGGVRNDEPATKAVLNSSQKRKPLNTNAMAKKSYMKRTEGERMYDLKVKKYGGVDKVPLRVPTTHTKLYGETAKDLKRPSSDKVVDAGGFIDNWGNKWAREEKTIRIGKPKVKKAKATKY